METSRPASTPSSLAEPNLDNPLLKRPSTKFAISIGFLALLANGIIIGLTLYYILGFFENDPEIAAFLPAVILCLCIGSVFLIPSFFTARLAHQTLKQTTTRARAVWSGMLNLPLLILSGFVLATGSLPFFYALSFGLWTLLFLSFNIHVWLRLSAT